MRITENCIRICSRLSIRKLFYTSIKHNHNSPTPVDLSFVSFEDTNKNNLHKSTPVFVLHGLLGSKTNWGTICKVLHERVIPKTKIIVADIRNHGESPHSDVHTYEAAALDVVALLKKENIKEVIFVGHSMGGRIGMYLALKFPTKVKKLVVLDIAIVSESSRFERITLYLDTMSSVKIPSNESLSNVRAAVNNQLKTKIESERVRAFLLTNLAQGSNGSCHWRVNIPALKANLHYIERFPLNPDSGIQYLGPTSFIAGGNSNALTEKQHPPIVKFFPKVQFYTIPGAGHWVHVDKPKELTALVLKILNETQ